MRKIRFHAGFILLTVIVAAGLGWYVGTQEFAQWTQNYAEMDAQDPSLLANVPLVKYEKSFDLGVLYGEVGTVTHDFSITNTGRGVLKLSDPIPEDDSVTCVLPKREIAPDETIFAKVSYTPQSEEEFDASVMIRTNVLSEPEMEISLLGNVHAAVWPEETVLEVAGVPTMSVFKTANRIYSLVKDQPLELSNLHVTDPQYADFFSFEQTDAYHYEYCEVVPLPESGKIITIAIKPGLPKQIFRVIVEGETNIPETPKFQFSIDFKLPAASPIPGVPGGLVPIIPTENPGAETPEAETSGAETSGAETSGAETSGGEPSGGEPSGAETSDSATSGAETSAVPEKIDLESDPE